MWFVALAVAAVPPRPCATMERLPHAVPVRRGPVLAAGPEKGQRDRFSLPNEAASDNFVVRWGSRNVISPALALTVLEHFETAWRVEVEQMRHDAPYGTDAFRFNVYVGDTGDGAPSAYGAGGYYSTDPEGWPMIVVARPSFDDADFLQQTAVHEFYHAIQGATDRFDYDGPAAWFWEATAEWAAVEAVPENPSNGLFVAGYLWLPDLPVNAFDYPDSGSLPEYHQYGAFLLPHDLTNHFGREIVTGTWKDRGTEPDPLEVLRARLADQGVEFEPFWLDHAARNSVLDYEIGDYLEQHLRDFSWAYPDDSPTFDTMTSWGGEGAARGQDALHRYGYHRIDVVPPTTKGLRFVIDGDAKGTRGSPASFGARVVQFGGEPVIHEVPFDGTHGELTLDAGAWGTARELRLVVGAWTPDNRHWNIEKFGFEYAVEPIEPPDPDDGARPRRLRDRVRSCDVGGASGGMELAAAAALAAVARSRRRFREVR